MKKIYGQGEKGKERAKERETERERKQVTFKGNLSVEIKMSVETGICTFHLNVIFP